ncbi:hypothetical protein AB0I55_04380 [Actinocatenispora sera]|uniref:TolB family protein n=1 Tax=Actinocatenispora sera TaxID=390989 RepID=UPI0033D6E731
MRKPIPVTVFAVALALGVTGCSVATGHASTGGPVRIRCAEPQSGGTLPTHRLTFAGLGLDAWTGSPRSPVSPSIAYDWDHHAYGDVPHPMISPQPGASLVAYVDMGSGFPNVLRLTHVDGSGDRSLTLPAAAVAAPQWSPDAKRVLVSVSDSAGRSGFAVVDPASGTVAAQWPGMKLRAPYFSWYGDGTKVAATVADGSAIQLYDLDGSAGDTVPVRGTVSGAGSWSPDLRHVVAHTARGNRVVATDTGTVVATLPAGNVPGAAAWWSDATHLLVRSTGEHGAIRLCLATLSGRITRKWVVPVPGDDRRPPALVLSRDS